MVAAVQIAAIALAALGPEDACGCARPVDLYVLNFSHDKATVSWSQPGILGTSLRSHEGGGVAAACETDGFTLRRGDVQLSIRWGTTTRTLTVHSRDGLAGTPVGVTISADGQILDPASPPYRADEKLCDIKGRSQP